MKYHFETTVLLWQDIPAISKDVKKICHSLKLQVVEAHVQEDFLAFPFFFAVVDGRKLTKELLDFLTGMIDQENEKEFAILLTHLPQIKIPTSIRKFFIKPNEVINFDFLKTQIYNKHFAIQRHKNNKRTYDKTVYRLMRISYLLRTRRKYIYLNELCNDFNVTDRTIKRDFDLLLELGDDIQYDKQKKGYYLAFSQMNIEFNQDYDT